MASRRRNTKRNPVGERLVGLYVRISKDRDNEISTDVQRDTGLRHIETQGWTHVTTFMDKGRSAYHHEVKRDEFEQMKVAVEKGVVNTVLVYKLDRLYRGTKELLALLEWLTDHNASLVSMTEPIDTAGDTGKILVTILAMLAELESDQKSDRIADWHGYRRERGVVPPGPAPYGYVITEEGNAWEIDPVAAKVVQEAAAAVLAGDSLASVGKAFGFPRHQVRRIMVNPHYAALRHVDGMTSPGEWPSILDMETHERLVVLLTDPSRARVWDNTPRRLLTGLVKCSVCGEALRIKNYPAKNGGSTYACMNAHMSLNADWLEAFVVEGMQGSIASLPEMEASESSEKLEAMKLELAHDLANGAIEPDEWKIIRAGLDERIASAKEVEARPDVSGVANWDAMTIEAQRVFLRRMVASLVVHPAGGRGKSFYSDEARIARVDLTWRR